MVFGLVKNLRIKFEKGKVVWFDSPQKKIFKKFLDTGSGDKNQIGEFAIGCNPAAKWVGETIMLE